MKGRLKLAKLALLGLTVALCLAGLEIAARLVMLADRDTPFQVTEYPLYEFDEHVGFRYRPNTKTENQQINALDQPSDLFRVRVNNHGHISGDDDPAAKPEGEFRIAVLGDSFTGSITNDTPWPDFLERQLDADEQLKASIGVDTIRTVNFGMDGTGIVQWPAVYRSQAARAKPDMVLVNFITHDLTRRFIWRAPIELDGGFTGFVACSSLPATLENGDCMFLNMAAAPPSTPDRLAKATLVRRELTVRQLKRAPWGSMYPHLLSAGLRRWGLARRFGTVSMRYGTEEGADASAAALREIVDAQSETLIFHIATLSDCLQEALSEELRNFATRDTGAPIQVLRDDFVGDDRGNPDAIGALFNLPSDGHFSEAGAERYAASVSERVRSRLLGKSSTLRSSDP